MFKIHLCAQHASRQASQSGMMALIEITALTCLSVCQYTVARGLDINKITVVLFKGAEMQIYSHCLLSLFHQNS